MRDIIISICYGGFFLAHNFYFNFFSYFALMHGFEQTLPQCIMDRKSRTFWKCFCFRQSNIQRQKSHSFHTLSAIIHSIRAVVIHRTLWNVLHTFRENEKRKFNLINSTNPNMCLCDEDDRNQGNFQVRIFVCVCISYRNMLATH